MMMLDAKKSCANVKVPISSRWANYKHNLSGLTLISGTLERQTSLALETEVGVSPGNA